MSIGPFQPKDSFRIPLGITKDDIAIEVTNPRVQQLILPDGTQASGYPKTMTRVKKGTYFLQVSFETIGHYLAIIQAEFGSDTLEEIETFVIEKPFGAPAIRIACH